MATNQSPASGRKIFLAGLAFVIAVLAYLLFSLAIDEEGWAEDVQIYQAAPTVGAELDFVEGNADISIPLQAREIYAWSSGARVITTYVMFKLPPDQLDIFITGTQCDQPLMPIAVPEKPEESALPDWWQPWESGEIMGCNGFRATLRQSIQIDISNSNLLTVYVVSSVDNWDTTPTFAE